MEGKDNDIILFDGGDSEEIMKTRSTFYNNPAPINKSSDDDDDLEDASIDDDTTDSGKPDAEGSQIPEVPNKADTDDPDGSESGLTEQFSTLKELGYLFLPEDYPVPTSDEEFEKAVTDSETYRRNAVLNEVWEGLPDEGRKLLEYMLQGGTDIKSFKDTFTKGLDLTKIDLSEKDHQKQVLKELYIKKGFSPEKAEKQINILDNMLELEDEAQDAFEELKEIDRKEKEDLLKTAKQKKEEKDREAQERYNILVQTLQKSDDFGGGYTIGSKAKPKALESLFKSVKTQEGKVMSDFNYRLHEVVLQDPRLTLVLSDVLNRLTTDKKTGEIYFDFNNLLTKAETKVTKSIKDKIDSLSGNANKFKGGASFDGKKQDFEWSSAL